MMDMMELERIIELNLCMMELERILTELNLCIECIIELERIIEKCNMEREM
jgi:hypothetical protein